MYDFYLYEYFNYSQNNNSKLNVVNLLLFIYFYLFIYYFQKIDFIKKNHKYFSCILNNNLVEMSSSWVDDFNSFQSSTDNT